MLSFDENRKYIQNEFEEAVYDASTGLSADALRETLTQMQNAPSDEPRPLFCAKAYAFVLDHARLAVNEHTPFSVKFDIGVNYSYFASADVYDTQIFQAQRRKVLHEKYPADFDKMLARHDVGMGLIWTDFWHTVPDWNTLLRRGFAGILADAKAAKTARLAAEHTKEQIDFLDSVILCYEAMLRMMRRMRDYASKFDAASFCEAIGALCEREPQTLYEVMLFSVLYLYFEEIGCERARTLGPIDRLYMPYYKNDLKRGVPKEELCDLFRYFFIHFTATKRYAEQPFTLGGADEHGNTYVNELTYLILDVYDGMNIYDPKIHLRCHAGMDEALLSKAVDMVRRGHNSICMVSDEAVFRGYERLGIPKSDAKDYVLLGCYEPIIMGKEEGEVGITWLNMVKCLEFAINGGRDILTGRQIAYESDPDHDGFDALLDTFFGYLDEALEFAIDFSQRESDYATLVNPSPVYSASFPACLAKAKDVHDYPLPYNNMSFKCFGLATVVDSLCAVKKYVFEKKMLTLAGLREALRADWEGYEDIRACILTDTDKYGNHRGLPDAVMRQITAHLAEKYVGRKLPRRGGVLRVGLDSIDQCVSFGTKTAATPDGRRARTPVSKNLCASVGMDKGGITAYMQSVLQIDAASFLNSAIFDFMLHPSAVEGERGLAAFGALYRIFFENGGFAMQGNVVGADTLRAAQKNPEQYATLQVRVCGWNEYFVRLNAVKQEQFIRRSEVSV